jgi:1-acyl-sn-glycerol-3-phosphate acyltransferase
MWRGLLAAGLFLWPILFFICFMIVLGCFLGTLFLGGAGLSVGIFVYGIYAVFRDSGWMERINELQKKWREGIYEILRDHVHTSFPLRGSLETIPRDKPVLYVCHPHGLFGMTWFFHFSTGLTGWPSDLARPRVAAHSVLFRFPFLRELSKSYGGIEATEEKICEYLRKGESVAIILGGVEEIYLSEEGKTRLVVEKRKGYARIAKKMGCPLVPLVSLGESELFPLVRGTWMDRFQDQVRSWFSFVVPVPTWKSLRSWFQLARGPLEKPVDTWCLKPVFPGRGIGMEKLKEQYVKRLREFAAEHSEKVEIVA